MATVQFNQPTINQTSIYPFAALSIGDHFTVYHRFQHCRVAASEYGRKHNMVFSCRMQEDRSMNVYRVELSQKPVDQRGRNGRRAIPAVNGPTFEQFTTYLATLVVGQSVRLKQYQDMFPIMSDWCSMYSTVYGVMITGGLWHDGTFMITRVS